MLSEKEIQKYRARLTPLASAEDHKREIGQNLKRAREKAGFTQDDVADIFNIGNRKTVQRYENGKSGCTLEQLNRFCQLYQCTLDDILPAEMLPWLSPVHNLAPEALDAIYAFAGSMLKRVS